MAREGRAAGKDIIDAVVNASKVRFRPIMMTSFTFILGVCRWCWRAARVRAHAVPSVLPLPAACSLPPVWPYCSCPAFFVVLQTWIRAKQRSADDCRIEIRSRVREIFHRTARARECPRARDHVARRSSAYNLPVAQYPPITPPTFR